MKYRICVFFVCAALAMSVLAARAADDWTQPFNGKDLTGWKLRGSGERSKWTVGTARLKAGDPAQFEVTPGGNELINAGPHSVDLYTEAKYGDVLVELELMVPRGSNSGIYLMGNYEVQVLDSFGKEKVNAGDLGGIYGRSSPKVNASKAPGEWQKFTIEFRAPKFDATGKKIAHCRFVKITLNDQVIQENVTLESPTGGALGPEAATGPLMIQGDHGPVALRNIRIKPLPAEK